MTREQFQEGRPTFEDLAQMAYKGGDRETYRSLLRSSEQCAYLALAYLYKLYKIGGISKEAAEKTKSQISRRYEKDRIREYQLDASIKAFAQVVKDTAIANENYRMNRTLENADKLCMAIDGVEVKANEYIDDAERERKKNEAADNQQ